MTHKSATTLSLDRVRVLPQMPAFSLVFPPGIHAIVCPRRNLAQALLECMAGLQKPLGAPWNKGNVLLGNTDPFSSPALRAALGVTLPEEPALPRGQTLRSSLEQLLDFQKAHDALLSVSPSSVPLIDDLLNQAPDSLSNIERRRVTLGLALALRAPQALLLYHPLSHLTLEETQMVLAHLRSLADAGKIIVCVTPTLADAERLSPHIQELGSAALAPQNNETFCVFCSEPQKIAELILEHPNSVQKFEAVYLPPDQPHRVLVTLAPHDRSHFAR